MFDFIMVTIILGITTLTGWMAVMSFFDTNNMSMRPHKEAAESHVYGIVTEYHSRNPKVTDWKTFSVLQAEAAQDAGEGNSFYCNPYTKQKDAIKYDKYYEKALTKRRIQARKDSLKERKTRKARQEDRREQVLAEKQNRREQALAVKRNRSSYLKAKQYAEATANIAIKK